MTTQPDQGFLPGQPASGAIVQITKGPLKDHILVVVEPPDEDDLVLCREDQHGYVVDLRWLKAWPDPLEVIGRPLRHGETEDEYRESMLAELAGRTEDYLRHVEQQFPEWLRRENPQPAGMRVEVTEVPPAPDLPGMGKVRGHD